MNTRFREVASRGLMLPTSCMEPYKLIQSPVTGLWEPQGRHRHLDLYLPTGVLRERKLDLEWNVGFASSFGEIGLPFGDEVLSGAAFRTVAELDPDWAINELLKRAWLL